MIDSNIDMDREMDIILRRNKIAENSSYKSGGIAVILSLFQNDMYKRCNQVDCLQNRLNNPESALNRPRRSREVELFALLMVVGVMARMMDVFDEPVLPEAEKSLGRYT